MGWRTATATVLMAGVLLVACGNSGSDSRIAAASIPTLPPTTVSPAQKLAQWSADFRDEVNALIRLSNDRAERIVVSSSSDARFNNSRYWNELADAARLLGLALDQAGTPPAEEAAMKAMRQATSDMDTAYRGAAACYDACAAAIQRATLSADSWFRALDVFLEACSCAQPL